MLVDRDRLVGMPGAGAGQGLRCRAHPGPWSGCLPPARGCGGQFEPKTSTVHLAAPLRLIRASQVTSGAPRDSASATYWAS